MHLFSTGTDEQAIIDVLTKRTNMQRQQIAISFKGQFGKVLSKQSHIQSLFHCIQGVVNGYTVNPASMSQTIHRSSANKYNNIYLQSLEGICEINFWLEKNCFPPKIGIFFLYNAF